jgi:three-Cys-motif partner protein
VSNKDLGVVWKAEPHTIAKTEVLRAYLVEYFQILGTSKPRQTILYVDGFAGPDEYTNFPHGSPTAALIAAQEAITNSQRRWIAGEIHCAFIEPDPKRFENMNKKIHPFRGVNGLKIHTHNADFVTGLAALRKDIPAPFCKSHPLFVFIDPFGATGAPFSAVREILINGCSEVLINVDADGIARIFCAKDQANYEELLTAIYGDRSWVGGLNDKEQFAMLCRKELNLYTTKLKSVAGVRYVFSFEMQKQVGALNYFLVFASKHPWIIVGGESGPHARPVQPQWVFEIRRQCRAAGVAFFFKQWGGVNKKKAGRVLSGRIYNEMPKVRQLSPSSKAA